MKAVLAVSFGTTVDETREKTIGAVERGAGRGLSGASALSGLYQPENCESAEKDGERFFLHGVGSP